MESKKPTTGKYSLNYGLILGGLGVVFGLMLYFADAHTSQSPVTQVISIVLSVGVIFWGLLQFKKANDGYLTIGQALKLGAGIALIAGIIQVLYTIFLANVLDPEFTSKIMDMRMEEAVAAGTIPADQVQQSKEMGEKFFWFGYPVMVIVSVIFGLVIGLVGGLIFKKSPEA